MARDTIKFALIGAGNIAKQYVGAIKNVPEASLEGVVTRDNDKACEFAKTHGINCWSDDMKAVFIETSIDAVIIATPNGLHAEAAIEAAKHHKHILCEKPLDITLEKIDAMTKECQAAGVKLGCSYQHRTFKHNQIIYEAIQGGKLGKIYIANAFLKNYRGQDYYDSGAWRGTWKLDGGGPFMQQASHTLDLMVWMMGGAKAVSAFTDTVAHTIEVEDMGHAIVKYANGAQGVLEASTVVQPGYPNRIEIHGERGSIIANEKGIIEWKVEGMEAPVIESEESASGSKDPKSIGETGQERLIRDFVKAITENREPLVSGESARLSVELILAVYESAKTGKVVNL